jgi:hypothetical protein
MKIMRLVRFFYRAELLDAFNTAQRESAYKKMADNYRKNVGL